MEMTFIEFDYSDNDLAELISNAIPPPGVKVSKPSVIIKASDEGGIFAHIVIEFTRGVRDVGLGILAAWLYDCLKESGKKSSRINRERVVLNKRNLLRVIKKELDQQKMRDVQSRRDKENLTRKTPRSGKSSKKKREEKI